MGILLTPHQLRKIMSGYNIANAALFPGLITAYMDRMFGAPTDQTTWTLSMFLQRSDLDRTCELFSSRNGFELQFDVSNNIRVSDGGLRVSTSALFRDTTAWGHLCVTSTGSLATVYWNNISIGTYAGAIAGINTDAVGHRIGEYYGQNVYLDMYLAEYYFIDGQALTPSDFGEIEAATGNWKAKAYTGTYGNNGFYLDFSDSLDLGKDVSGNANNWTKNGTITQVTSTPTDTAATWNPLKPNASSGAGYVNGNKTVTRSGLANVQVPNSTLMIQKTIPIYCEFTIGSGDTSYGIVSYQEDTGATGIVGSDNTYAEGWGVYCENNASYYGFWHNGVRTSFNFSGGTVYQLAFDQANGKIWFGKDGTWYNSGDPTAGTNATYTGISTTLDLFIGGQAGAGITMVATAADWTYTAPAGFLALTTNNLPARSPATPSTPQTGTFTGNALADGPCINLGMAIDQSLTSIINGNAIIWGTHADALAIGVKIRTSSASYNAAGSNTYSFAVKAYTGGLNVVEATAQGNPE